MSGCVKHASNVTKQPMEHANLSASASDGALFATKKDRKEQENVSEIVNMNQKIRTLVDQVTANSTPGDRVSFEMMMTFAYTNGYQDGYTKGYMEAFCEPSGEERSRL